MFQFTISRDAHFIHQTVTPNYLVIQSTLHYLIKYSTLTQYTIIYGALNCVVIVSWDSTIHLHSSHNLLVVTCSPNKLYLFKGCHIGHLKLIKLKSPQH